MRTVDRRCFLEFSISSAFLLPFYGLTDVAFGQYRRRDALELSMIIDNLEGTADALSLAPAEVPLPETISPRTSLDSSNVYLEGMPRLLALISRSEGDERANSLADNASAYLSALTRNEHSFTQPARKTTEPRRVAQDAPPKTGPQATSGSAPKASAAEYRTLYDKCEVDPDREATVKWHIQQLKYGRKKYDEVAAATGVPWYFIGILHALEASFNFRGHLYNGDEPLSKKTRHVPKNRPRNWSPPFTWEASAQHSLRDQGFTNLNSWQLEDMLYRFESYNGFGYRRKNIRINSPYLWSFSNHYVRGKFVADREWSRNAVSQQCGAAVMLKYLEKEQLVAKL